jgi:hypothetical protein
MTEEVFATKDPSIAGCGKTHFCTLRRDQLTWRVGIRIVGRMRNKAIQQGRSE